VEARAVGGAGVRRVGAGEDRHARLLELADGGERVPELEALVGREGPAQGGGLVGAQVGRETGIVRQGLAARGPGRALDHGEGRRHERLVRLDQPGEARLRRPVGEDVDEAVRSRLDRLLGAILGADVDHRQLAVLVGGLHQRREGRPVEGRQLEAVRRAVLQHDLDVVRPLGHAGVDPGLRLLRPGQRRDGHAVLRAVAAGSGGEVARAVEVGPPRRPGLRLLLAHLPGEVGIGEHVELGGDAEDERPLQRVAPGVGVAVDEAGEDRLAGAVDDRGPPGRDDVRARGGDSVPLEDDGPLRDHPGAVEDADVDDGGRNGLGRGPGDPARGQQDSRKQEMLASDHDGGSLLGRLSLSQIGTGFQGANVRRWR
jgi:hypothetical protein